MSIMVNHPGNGAKWRWSEGTGKISRTWTAKFGTSLLAITQRPQYTLSQARQNSVSLLYNSPKVNGPALVVPLYLSNHKASTSGSKVVAPGPATTLYPKQWEWEKDKEAHCLEELDVKEAPITSYIPLSHTKSSAASTAQLSLGDFTIYRRRKN